MIIDVIAGVRPNFMKVAALFAVADHFPALNLRLIHTGQHYDENMSEVFFRDLMLPPPVQCLNVGSGSHAVQTAAIMVGYEKWVKTERPDLTAVVGDVNSTVACALVAAKEGIPIAHIEAGLRSFDPRMPEEINRIVTDRISDLMFATEPSGVANLAHEGRPLSAIHLVGHVMIDTLFNMKSKAEALLAYGKFNVRPNEYAYLTVHRPSNVDDVEQLNTICTQILWLTQRMPVVFSVHPRTRRALELSGWFAKLETVSGLHLSEPLDYLSSVSVMLNARLVITDSGGLQEESSALGIPCLTLRDTTERPITLTEGTNSLIGGDWGLFQQRVEQNLRSDRQPTQSQIPYWDGKASMRILSVISQNAQNNSNGDERFP